MKTRTSIVKGSNKMIEMIMNSNIKNKAQMIAREMFMSRDDETTEDILEILGVVVADGSYGSPNVVPVEWLTWEAFSDENEEFVDGKETGETWSGIFTIYGPAFYISFRGEKYVTLSKNCIIKILCSPWSFQKTYTSTDLPGFDELFENGEMDRLIDAWGVENKIDESIIEQLKNSVNS